MLLKNTRKRKEKDEKEMKKLEVFYFLWDSFSYFLLTFIWDLMFV